VLGPVAVAVGVAALAYKKFADDLEAAEQRMQEAAAAAAKMNAIVKNLKTTEARLELERLVATGQAASEELIAVQAEEQAEAQMAELVGGQRGKLMKATRKLQDEEAKLVELRDNLRSAMLADEDAYEAQKLVVERSANAKRREQKALDGLSSRQDRLTEKYYNTAIAIRDAGKASGGGAKSVSELNQLLQEADKLSTPAKTKIEMLNEVLNRLQSTTAKNEKEAAALAVSIAGVTEAIDVETTKQAATASKEQAAALKAAQSKTDALVKSLDSMALKYEDPISEIDRLRNAQDAARGKLAQIVAEAERLGIAGTEAFAAMAAAAEANLARIQAAIDGLQPPKKIQSQLSKALGRPLIGIGRAMANFFKPVTDVGKKAADGIRKLTNIIPQEFKDALKNEMKAVGQSMSGLAKVLTGGAAGSGVGAAGVAQGALGVVSSGGATAVEAAASMAFGAGAGPVAGAAMQLGMGGAQQYEQAKAEKAQEIAAKRQEEMAAEREQKLAQGFSEEQLAAQGLSAEDVSEAGQVTKEDEAKAEQQVDRGEEMGKFVEGLVMGVVEGIKSIIVGLPDILETLIPILLTEFPAAIISSLFRMIPKMIRMWFVELPKALFKGVKKAFNAIWRSIKKFFKDIFSFGFATGTSAVPKTGRYILHQGERVVPSNGASTGTAESGLAAFAGPSGPQVTLNAAVVSPDTVPALSRILEGSLGAYGRTTSPFFGTKTPETSI